MYLIVVHSHNVCVILHSRSISVHHSLMVGQGTEAARLRSLHKFVEDAERDETGSALMGSLQQNNVF